MYAAIDAADVDLRAAGADRTLKLASLYLAYNAHRELAVYPAIYATNINLGIDLTREGELDSTVDSGNAKPILTKPRQAHYYTAIDP